jgi:hypothetical protein
MAFTTASGLLPGEVVEAVPDAVHGHRGARSIR